MSMVQSVIRNCYGVAEDSTEPFQSSPKPSYDELIILIPFSTYNPEQNLLSLITKIPIFCTHPAKIVTIAN